MPEKKLSNEEILARYLAVPDQLETAIAGLSKSNLDVAHEPGKWTIRQIVYHLIDADDLAKTIIKAALGNSGCFYEQQWYDPNNSWADTLDYSNRAIEPAIALFRTNHHHLEQLLNHLPNSLERFVILKHARTPEEKKVTVAYLLQAQTWHAQHHIEQILATRKVHDL